MTEIDLPHNELVWWRMTRKQKYLPGRVVVLEQENETVGIEEEHEKLLKKLIKPGSIIIHSFDDMKYAVCNSSNVRLYPTISEEEQKSLEKECMKSSKINYRALLRIKKILEIRQLDQLRPANGEVNMSPLEINMIKFFKSKDSATNLAESIEFFEKNTAIEILGSILNRKCLKTMIGQSPQAYSYLDQSLKNENDQRTNNKEKNINMLEVQTIESRRWQSELNEITVNRKTVCELLSCVPMEILSSKRDGKECVELNNNEIFTKEWENSICESFNGKNINTANNGLFIAEYIKLSILYLRILSKTIALRVVNANVGKHKRIQKSSFYVIVLCVGNLFGDPYDDYEKFSSFFNLKDNELSSCSNKYWLEFLRVNSSSKSSLYNLQRVTRKIASNNAKNEHGLSFCFKTTTPDFDSRDKSLFYKVDLNRISSQLVLSEELREAYINYKNIFTLKDLEARSKVFHKIKSSCPIMVKLFREWSINHKKGDFDLSGSLEQIKKIRETLLNIEK